MAPKVMKGPYKGDELSVDHIIPRAVVPELDNVIANLELLPLRMNESKNDSLPATRSDNFSLAMSWPSGVLSLKRRPPRGGMFSRSGVGGRPSS